MRASADDRLPWLDAAASAPSPPRTRRARTPLFALLGLFFAGAIAVMAYLAGRSTAPVADSGAANERVAERRAPPPLRSPLRRRDAAGARVD